MPSLPPTWFFSKQHDNGNSHLGLFQVLQCCLEPAVKLRGSTPTQLNTFLSLILQGFFLVCLSTWLLRLFFCCPGRPGNLYIIPGCLHGNPPVSGCSVLELPMCASLHYFLSVFVRHSGILNADRRLGEVVKKYSLLLKNLKSQFKRGNPNQQNPNDKTNQKLE